MQVLPLPRGAEVKYWTRLHRPNQRAVQRGNSGSSSFYHYNDICSSGMHRKGTCILCIRTTCTYPGTRLMGGLQTQKQYPNMLVAVIDSFCCGRLKEYAISNSG